LLLCLFLNNIIIKRLENKLDIFYSNLKQLTKCFKTNLKMYKWKIK
jgi:hypothetical protein